MASVTQDFIGIDYGLIDCKTYDPLPDYWGGLLWSQVMGRGVVKTSSNSTIRAYAHCSSSSSGSSGPGDLSVMLLNLQPASDAGAKPRRVILSSSAAAAATTEYHLTSGGADATSTSVRLNGVVLRATSAGLVPDMVGRAGRSDAVFLEPASITFVIIHGAGAAHGC
eukprot:COSAG05_NODE_678_length_7984_cov_3.957134_2_plen_167_part_00